MSDNIKILNVVFDFPLASRDGVLFKKAICSAIHDLRESGQTEGLSTELFYNRDEETGNTENRYPLIHYKSVNGKAAITAINQGKDVLIKLLELLGKKENVTFNQKHIGNRQNKINLRNYNDKQLEKVSEFKIRTLAEEHLYIIYDWLPLDTDRHNTWISTKELKMLSVLFDESLPRQLSRMLSGVGINYSFPFVAHTAAILSTMEMQQIYEEKKVPFHCIFSTNLDLPEDIGIGQVPGIGYGRIFRYKLDKIFKM